MSAQTSFATACFAGFCVAAASQSAAQTPPKPQSPAPAGVTQPSKPVAGTDLTRSAAALLTNFSPDPAPTSAIVTPAANFTLTAGPDGEEAKAKIGWQKGNTTAAISFSGKLNKQGDTHVFGTTGLPADFTGALAVSHLFWKPTVNEAAAAAVCVEYGKQRSDAQGLVISGDTNLTEHAAGTWTAVAAGDLAQVSWTFGDDTGLQPQSVRFGGRVTVSHSYEKAGIYQVIATVSEVDRFAADYGNPQKPIPLIVTVRSWLVAVNAVGKTASPANRYAQRMVGDQAQAGTLTLPPAIDRAVPFEVQGVPGETGIIDYGDGVKESLAAFAAGSQTNIPHRFTREGFYEVAAGLTDADGVNVVVRSGFWIGPDCSISAQRDVAPDLARRHALAVDWSHPIIAGFKYEAGRSTFEYVDKTTGEEQSPTDAKPWSVTGLLGTILGDGTSLALEAGQTRTFKPGKSTTLCTPFAASSTHCDGVVLGEPSKSLATVVSATAQRVFSGHFGLQPRLNWKRVDQKWTAGFDLPVYFLQNTANGLNGGLMAHWQQRDGWSAVLFVGALSDLFGQ